MNAVLNHVCEDPSTGKKYVDILDWMRGPKVPLCFRVGPKAEKLFCPGTQLTS